MVKCEKPSGVELWMKTVLIVGHSHIGCIQQAHSERGSKVEGLNIEFGNV
jgi:hypothetical protein